MPGAPSPALGKPKKFNWRATVPRPTRADVGLTPPAGNGLAWKPAEIQTFISPCGATAFVVPAIGVPKRKRPNQMSDLHSRRQAIIDRAKARGALRLNAEEDAEFRDLFFQIEDQERRDALHATARKFTASQARTSGQSEYRHDAYSDQRHSYVRDLISSVTPAVDTSGEGQQRLEGLETRNVRTFPTHGVPTGPVGGPARRSALGCRCRRAGRRR